MNTAKQQKKKTRLIGIAIFICFVIISGLALKITGKTDDPFTNMSDIVDMRQMLAQTNPSDSLPQVNGSADSDVASPISADNHNNSITWSAWGEVMYDLWFICATTAVVIVCNYPVTWFVKLLSRKPSTTIVKHSSGEDSPAF